MKFNQNSGELRLIDDLVGVFSSQCYNEGNQIDSPNILWVRSQAEEECSRSGRFQKPMN